MSTREERQAGIDAAVFRTITSADWRESLVRARRAGNAVSAQIRQKILDLKLAKSQPGAPGEQTKEASCIST